jgi:hypothetical protein
MSFRIRGQEVNLRFVIDGVVMTGTWVKVPDFTLTPRDDLVEEDYVGEVVSDLDYQHHGFDISGTMHVQDSTTLEFLMDIVAREKAHQRPPDISVQVFFAFREVGEPSKNLVLRNVLLKVDLGFGGRKEYVATRFEGKAKHASLMAA